MRVREPRFRAPFFNFLASLILPLSLALVIPTLLTHIEKKSYPWYKVCIWKVRFFPFCSYFYASLCISFVLVSVNIFHLSFLYIYLFLRDLSLLYNTLWGRATPKLKSSTFWRLCDKILEFTQLRPFQTFSRIFKVHFRGFSWRCKKILNKIDNFKEANFWIPFFFI